MISNITNALPLFLKQLKDGVNKSRSQQFNLSESIKFFSSIFPKNMELVGLKHIFLDITFKVKENAISAFNNFMISADTIAFLKQFKYQLNRQLRIITIKGNLQQFAILSLILIGSIKNLSKENKNKSIFISMCAEFLKYCIKNDYKVCKEADIELLQDYNDGFNENIFQSCSINPSSQNDIATFHFVGIQMNYDILKIFEKYKNVKFSYNFQNASFLITMQASNWDDFWNLAPDYLKNQLSLYQNK